MASGIAILVIVLSSIGGIIVLGIIIACYCKRKKIFHRGIIVDAQAGSFVNGGQPVIATVLPPYQQQIPGSQIGQVHEQPHFAQPAGAPHFRPQMENPMTPPNFGFQQQPNANVHMEAPPPYTPNSRLPHHDSAPSPPFSPNPAPPHDTAPQPPFTRNLAPPHEPAHNVTGNDVYTQLDPALRGRVPPHNSHTNISNTALIVPEQSPYRQGTQHALDRGYLTATHEETRRGGHESRRRINGSNTSSYLTPTAPATNNDDGYIEFRVDTGGYERPDDLDTVYDYIQD